MKQVWIIATGGRENLQLRKAPDLQPQAGSCASERGSAAYPHCGAAHREEYPVPPVS
jgi:hypothetical protein